MTELEKILSGKPMFSELRKWRKAQGISGLKLAKILNCPQSTLSKIELGEAKASVDLSMRMHAIGIPVEIIDGVSRVGRLWQAFEMAGQERLGA